MQDCFKGDEAFGACRLGQQVLGAANQPLEMLLCQGNGTINGCNVAKTFTQSGWFKNGFVKRHLNTKCSKHYMELGNQMVGAVIGLEGDQEQVIYILKDSKTELSQIP